MKKVIVQCLILIYEHRIILSRVSTLYTYSLRNLHFIPSTLLPLQPAVSIHRFSSSPRPDPKSCFYRFGIGIAFFPSKCPSPPSPCLMRFMTYIYRPPTPLPRSLSLFSPFHRPIKATTGTRVIFKPQLRFPELLHPACAWLSIDSLSLLFSPPIFHKP